MLNLCRTHAPRRNHMHTQAHTSTQRQKHIRIAQVNRWLVSESPVIENLWRFYWRSAPRALAYVRERNYLPVLSQLNEVGLLN